MKERFAQISAIVVFFAIFIGLLSLMGNPAKEETIISFVVALGSGVFIYHKFGGVFFKEL